VRRQIQRRSTTGDAALMGRQQRGAADQIKSIKSNQIYLISEVQCPKVLGSRWLPVKTWFAQLFASSEKWQLSVREPCHCVWTNWVGKWTSVCFPYSFFSVSPASLFPFPSGIFQFRIFSPHPCLRGRQALLAQWIWDTKDSVDVTNDRTWCCICRCRLHTLQTTTTLAEGSVVYLN